MPDDQSSLAMPGWRAPDHLGEPFAEHRGRIEDHVVASASRPGAKVPLKVYLPAGYDQGRDPLPVALVVGGDGARELGLLPRSLDNLIPQRVAPLLVAFLGRTEWGDKPPAEAEEDEALAELLATDVVGFLDGRYRTDRAPETRGVVGTGWGAATAASVVFRRPKVFGALGMQSVSMLDTDGEVLLKQAPEASGAPLRVYLDWGKYDRRATREAWDMSVTNARFAAFLRERGYKPAGGEVPEGSGWASWRNRTDRVFGTLFPPPGAAAAAAAASAQ
jgi:enterochelin esterase-like enzyme